MSIPNNINRSHLLQAIEKIDKEGYDFNAESSLYDVLYNGRRYPPKLIVSWANIFANGEELNRKEFYSGPDKPTFSLLEKNDFRIIKKNEPLSSFYEQIVQFLKVAKKQTTGEGTTLEATAFNQQIPKKYADLTVDVSFGIGRATAIPWISFLANGQKTSHGIYPVYLFYKDINLLILAYGVSETTKPIVNWDVDKAITIEQYFSERNLKRPKKYGQSLVFKVYDTSKPLSKEEIDQDINHILNVYNNNLSSSNNLINSWGRKVNDLNSIDSILLNETFNYLDFHNSCGKANLFISKSLAFRFNASLLTKPFVILTGLSGSGKTKLAQAFAMWICADENQYCIVPVGAEWTNREPLLGFPNALEKESYVKPDNGVLDLIFEANNNQHKPYFLILDEMNLSHVERYFADFLSVMESRNKIALHSGDIDWSGVPSTISFPKNLFIIGTVNIDETTYMFSPKVLDRASVIEFKVTTKEMGDYLQSNAAINLEELKGEGKNMAESFVELAKDTSIEAADAKGLNKTLMSFFAELKKTGAEFGYRSASEIIRFAAIANKLDAAWSTPEITDAAIMQKLLPKVHGSRRKLEPVLNTLGSLCLQEGEKMQDYISKSEIDFADSSKIKYPVSLEKIIRMYDSLISNGFTSYAEA
ncbi:MAG: DUF3578 domain-containing protein [Opitutaceae bacterium]|nr:DUF3578 domain-containing protein [Cytophagales bacterium]